MNNIIILGVSAALTTGIATGMQSTLSSRLGVFIGPFRTGLLTNLIGRVVARILILAAYFLTRNDSQWVLSRTAIVMLAASGTPGIMIITGISFSFERTGVTAGFAAVLFGQLLVSIIVDATGLGGVESILLDLRRFAGLGVMAVAIALLMPRE